MLVRFIEAVLLCAFFSASAYSVARLIGSLGASMTEKSGCLEAVRLQIARRSGLERSLAQRVGERRKAMAHLDREIKELTRTRSQLEQAAAEALETPDQIMRVVGHEINGMLPYLGLVLNKYVKAEGGTTSIDPAWAYAQEIQVWAKSLGEARGELERRYPESQGYKITSMADPAWEKTHADELEM